MSKTCVGVTVAHAQSCIALAADGDKYCVVHARLNGSGYTSHERALGKWARHVPRFTTPQEDVDAWWRERLR